MGIDMSRAQRSYTELYFPADSFRQCRASPCWCGRHHRDPRFMFIGRDRHGREQYHDPLDYWDRFMDGGAWPSRKRPSDWRERDYDKLEEVMNNLQDRAVGRRMRGFGADPSWMILPDIYGSGRRMQSGGQAWDPDMMNYMIQEQVRNIARHYDERYRPMREAMFGSDRDHMEELLMRQQARLRREYQPDLSAGMSNMGLYGMQMPGMMNQNMNNPMGQMLASPGGMHGGMGGGYGGMGGHSMMANGGWPGHMNRYGGLQGVGGLPPRRRAGIGGAWGRGGGRDMYEEDDYDDYNDLMGDGGLRRGRRRGGYNGIFEGGDYGDASKKPRGPKGVPRRPPRPNDGQGGGGAVFENEDIDPNAYQTAPPRYERRAPYTGDWARSPRPRPRRNEQRAAHGEHRGPPARPRPTQDPDIVTPRTQSPIQEYTPPPSAPPPLPRVNVRTRPPTTAPPGGDSGQQYSPPPPPGAIRVDLPVRPSTAAPLGGDTRQQYPPRPPPGAIRVDDYSARQNRTCQPPVDAAAPLNGGSGQEYPLRPPPGAIRADLATHPSTAAPLNGDLGLHYSPPPLPGAIHVDDYNARQNRQYQPPVDTGMNTHMPSATRDCEGYTYPDLAAGRPKTPQMGESYNPAEPLTRPRDEETRRGEHEAGAPPGTRDTSPH